jgi:hypothetical protein
MLDREIDRLHKARDTKGMAKLVQDQIDTVMKNKLLNLEEEVGELFSELIEITVLMSFGCEKRSFNEIRMLYENGDRYGKVTQALIAGSTLLQKIRDQVESRIGPTLDEHLGKIADSVLTDKVLTREIKNSYLEVFHEKLKDRMTAWINDKAEEDVDNFIEDALRGK